MTKINVRAISTVQVLIARCSSDGGSLKLDVMPAGGAPAGIWESATPGGRPTDIIAKRWTLIGVLASGCLCKQRMFSDVGIQIQLFFI